MRLRLTFLIFFLLIHYTAAGQPEELTQAVTTEYEALAEAEKHGMLERIPEIHTNIGVIYRTHSEYRKAITHYLTALRVSQSRPMKWNPTETLLELGIAYLRIMDLDSAELFLQRGFAANKVSGDQRMDAQLHNMSGNVMKDRGRYKDALVHYIHSSEIFERLRDKDGLTQAVSNIGNMHYLMDNFPEAEKYAVRSLAIARDIGKKMSIAYSNRLLGRIYRKQQRFDDALQAYHAAIGIYEQLGARRDIGETHLNRGNIYFEKEDFRSALNEYLSGIRSQKLAQDTFTMAYTFSAAGQAYQQVADVKKARAYLDSAMILANRLHIATLKADIFNILSTMYADTKDYKQAYEYHLKFSTINDSLAQVDQRDQAEELAARYESEKKENEIRTLNAENEVTALQLHERNNERKYLIAFCVLVLALVGVIYNRYQIKSRTTKKLRELDELKSRFFANLSHEFRTPLTLITVPLTRTLGRMSDDQDTITVNRSDVEMMNRNAARLQRMIDQLLDLSRIESGKMPLTVVRGDLGRLMRVVFASFESLASQKRVAFELVTSDTLSDIYYDQDKVEKIVYNLLSNAFKFTPPGGKVTLRAGCADGRVTITVCDSGMGIPTEQLGHIFERFYQVDASASGAREGSGIGLSLSRELATLHRGTLTVISSPGKGSEFTFSFPADSHAYPHVVTAEEPEMSVGKDPGEEDIVQSGKPIALVAEDNHDMQTLIRELLLEHFDVIVSSDGNNAWTKSLETVPDIIVCDLMMPGIDGMTLCNQLKSHPATSHIPVVMLTARGDQESRLSGLETGADDYLTKPFHPKELLVRVTNLVSQRTRLQQFYSKNGSEERFPRSESAFLEKVEAILEQRYSDPEFKLDQFCTEIGMSRMQLHRKLKALTDKSPGEFLREFRMSHARRLLATGQFQVSEVAYQVGYNNLSHFTKTFREFVGCNPSDYTQTAGKGLRNGA